MLLICSGPDTWHARRKATALQDAFREKHDPQSLSTEILRSVDLPKLLNLLASPSLFSTKRFIRCDGLLESLKIAEIRSLAKRLKDDADQTIVVTVEDEPPAKKILDEFSEIKCVQYAHPVLSPAAFTRWCVERAQEQGVDAKVAAEIAQHMDGDVWLAEQEIIKKAANPSAPAVHGGAEEDSAFILAEYYLTQRTGWRTAVASFQDDQISTVFVAQSRTAVRVADHEVQGLHPYTIKKISQLRIPSSIKSLMHAIRMLVATRQGLANRDESQTVL